MNLYLYIERSPVWTEEGEVSKCQPMKSPFRIVRSRHKLEITCKFITFLVKEMGNKYHHPRKNLSKFIELNFF